METCTASRAALRQPRSAAARPAVSSRPASHLPHHSGFGVAVRIGRRQLDATRAVITQRESSMAAGKSRLGEELPYCRDCVYLDYNATTPIFPEVAEEMQPFLYEAFGNPSSVHAYGKKCKDAVDLARQRVATAVGASSPDEIYFTSCGTESDNWAILSAIGNSDAEVPHVVTTNIEHPAISEMLRSLERQGKITFTAVGVSHEGIVSVDDIEAALRPETCLITIMHGNNEIGALQPIKEIAQRVDGMDILVHTDAAQSLGKVKVDVQDMGVDMATFVGHKIGAPKGVGALYVRSGVKLPPLLLGGAQERGMRAGTESVLLLSGFGKAADMLVSDGEALFEHQREMRAYLRACLEQTLPADRLRFNGPTCDTKRTANTLNVSIKGVNASLLLLELKVWAILLRYIPLVRGCPDAALVQTSDMACFARVRC